VVGFPGPLVVHAVQHLLHPAGLLKEWPDEDRRCKLVFITDNLSAERLEQSLQLLQ
jgi:G3E family GTPase